MLSPATPMVMTFEVSPAAKLTMPDGSTPPVKSVPLTAAPVTAHWALAAPLRSPVRVTVKVKGVLPDWPSALSALVAAIDNDAGATSSLRMRPLAEAMPRLVPAPGLDSVTEKASSGSTMLSPATPMVMTFEVSPAAKLTVPDGSTPPVKSAPLTAAPVTAHWALERPVRSPVRVTVKVKSVLPDWPSALSALVAAIDNDAGATSSLRMRPLAEAMPRLVPAPGLDSVTEKASSGSTMLSPATPMVMTFEVSPAAKLTMPDGSTPPVKSAPLTAAPLTVQSALAGWSVLPVRVTVKVNGVLPDWPSALSALAAAIDKDASSSTIEPVALLSRIDAPSDGADRETAKLSLLSTIASPTMAIRMFCCVTPGAKVRIPLWAT